jgi:DNA-binding CsgD family transcriptional regulator
MIHWFDSFMALFGYARPEVWGSRAQGARRIVSRTACVPRRHETASWLQVQRAAQAGKCAEKESREAVAKCGGFGKCAEQALTLSELRKDSGKCHAIYQMVDAFTDEQIAKEIGATVRAVQDYRLARRMEAQMRQITKRELEVMREIGKGYTYHETGQVLQISHETVRAHLQNIYRKLSVDNRVEALNKLRDKL